MPDLSKVASIRLGLSVASSFVSTLASLVMMGEGWRKHSVKAHIGDSYGDGGKDLYYFVEDTIDSDFSPGGVWWFGYAMWSILLLGVSVSSTLAKEEKNKRVKERFLPKTTNLAVSEKIKSYALFLLIKGASEIPFLYVDLVFWFVFKSFFIEHEPGLYYDFTISNCAGIDNDFISRAINFGTIIMTVSAFVVPFPFMAVGLVFGFPVFTFINFDKMALIKLPTLELLKEVLSFNFSVFNDVNVKYTMQLPMLLLLTHKVVDAMLGIVLGIIERIQEKCDKPCSYRQNRITAA